MSDTRHTAPLSVIIGALGAIRSAVIPAISMKVLTQLNIVTPSVV